MTTAKPAGEPRWTLERHDDYSRILDAGDWVLTFLIEDAARAESIVAALNAAETRAAQPGDAPKLTDEEARDIAQVCAVTRLNGWRKTAEALDALLASRSTPAAPASTEAPGALAADEIIEETLKYYEFAFEKNWVVEDTLQAIRGLKGKFILAAPSTEALIAAGDALRANMMNLRHADGSRAEDCTTCKRLDAEWRAAVAALHPASATQAALAATPPALTADQLAQRFHETYERLAPSFGYETRKDSAVPWESVPEKNRKLMVAVCAELLPAARPGGEETLSRLRKAVDACIYAGSRLNSLAESLVIEHRVSHQDYDASNVLSADWEAAKTDLCALLAELERPGDLPSV